MRFEVSLFVRKKDPKMPARAIGNNFFWSILNDVQKKVLKVGKNKVKKNKSLRYEKN